MTRLCGLSVLTAVMLVITQGSYAGPIVYTAHLNGLSESPPTTSPGFGDAEVDFDSVAQTMRVEVTFSGLSTGTTASHIHAPTMSPGTGTAGIATTTPTFPEFPLGVTSGTYDHTFDMTLASSYNPAFITANGGTTASAEIALAADIAAGEAYWNVHTQTFPGGEIRGFLVPVPEPSSVALLILGGIALVATRCRRAL